MLPNQQYTPEDLLRIAKRRLWIVLLPFVATTIGVATFTRTLPNKYRSETLILVVPQRVPEDYVRSTVTARIEDRLTTIQQQILSRTRLEPLIREFGLYPKEQAERPMEDVVELMRNDIHVTIERGDAFRVSHDSQDPLVAQQVVKRLAQLFINENLQDRERLADGTSEFLETQLEDAKRHLIEHEQRLEEYRTRHSGELPSQVDANLQAIQTTQLQLQQLSESVNRDKERRLALERQLFEVETSPAPAIASTGSDPVPTSTAQQLDNANAKLAALLQRYKPEHPDVLTTRRQIRDLEAQLQAEAARQPAGTSQPARVATGSAEIARQNQIRALKGELTTIDTQLARKEDQDKQLRRVLTSYQVKVDAAPARESDLVELTRDYATLQQTYQGLLARRENSKIAANLERQQVGEQFKVLDPPRVPERPFSPNRLRINVMGAAAGLMIGLALVFVLEYRDRSIKTANEFVRVLKLPVLALIPLMQSEREAQLRRRRKLLTAMAVGLAATGSAAAYLLWTLRVI